MTTTVYGNVECIETLKASDTDDELVTPDADFLDTEDLSNKIIYKGFDEWYGHRLAMVAYAYRENRAIIFWQAGSNPASRDGIKQQIVDYLNQ
jgi:hypothetical protein